MAGAAARVLLLLLSVVGGANHLRRGHRLPQELLLVVAERVDKARQRLGRLVGVCIGRANGQLLHGGWLLVGGHLLLLLLLVLRRGGGN